MGWLPDKPRPTMTDEPTDTDDAETNHNLNESADKIRLKTQLKRGEGTRDQDTHDLKARGETPEEAAENLSDVISELEERDVFERARNIQPEVSDDEESDADE